MTTKEVLKIAVDALNNKKALDLQIIKIAELSVIAEYFVICTGSSTTQIKALADEVEFKLRETDNPPLRLEGYQSGNWIVVDFGCIIVHVFHPEMREFYNLERLWADGEKVEADSI